MNNEEQISNKKLIAAQIIFWICYYVFYSIFEGRFYGYGPGFASTAVSTVFTIVIFYCHALYLFPKFFKGKKYSAYFLYSFLLLTVMVAFRLYGEYLALSDVPEFGTEAVNTSKIIYRYVMGIIAMVISVPIKYMFDYSQLQAKQQQIKNQQLETEMKYLKLQINPHFLFNTLNNLLYLTKKKSDDAPGVVEKLADLMRYLLEKEEEDLVSLEEEIKFIDSYLELERIRIPSVEINIEKKGKLSRNIPPMLLIPLVENAFKHGIDKSNTDNIVNIKLDITGNTLNFSVRNPLSNIDGKTNGGKGLNNLRKRLELLYPKEYKLVAKADDSNNIFKAELTIPVS